MTGSHVVLATPTGSGKSMVAMGAQFAALAARRSGLGGRTFYTAPLKALVSEKFFDLVAAFGSRNVGMMTGDSAVNPGAPIICCTAEILANLALRGSGTDDAPAETDGERGDDAIAQVVMDEFHFYGDPQRGWAWQVPLLELPDTQFLLMSATLGDTTQLREDLEERSGRPVAEVAGAERPVPLTFSYVVEPLLETITELVTTHRAPVYVVHFTQKDAVERAQALLSAALASKAEKAEIAAEIGAFRFGTGFGKTLSKFLRAGIGVHHAGMLPKYRRLVERLTQKGLLKVVCGTDTLGVGINVPIRTVLMTSLVKFDGERMRHLTAREFHQIAGRAGRAGFDTVGEVLVMAPEHVIENRKLLAKAGDDPKKLKKIVRKKAPAGAVNWTESTFERLRDADPEPLSSQFRVNHAMVLNVLARTRDDDATSDPVEAMRHLLTANHDTEAQQAKHVRQVFRIYRSLRVAGVVEKVRVADDSRPAGYRPSVRLVVDLPRDFALNAPLSPFALAAMDLLDVESPTHALDVVSVIEATLDDPRQILYGQQNKARGEAVAAMKAEGMEYEERMEALEDVTWPTPLADLLAPAFDAYKRSNPWVADAEPSPKSVVRDMLEQAMTFAELVSVYGLERTEGVVLRYLADAYRAVRQVVPDEHRTEEVAEIVEWLGELVRGVDSSLLDEWERLQNPVDDDADDVVDGALAAAAARPPAPPRAGPPAPRRARARRPPAGPRARPPPRPAGRPGGGGGPPRDPGADQRGQHRGRVRGHRLPRRHLGGLAGDPAPVLLVRGDAGVVPAGAPGLLAQPADLGHLARADPAARSDRRGDALGHGTGRGTPTGRRRDLHRPAAWRAGDPARAAVRLRRARVAARARRRPDVGHGRPGPRLRRLHRRGLPRRHGGGPRRATRRRQGARALAVADAALRDRPPGGQERLAGPAQPGRRAPEGRRPAQRDRRQRGGPAGQHLHRPHLQPLQPDRRGGAVPARQRPARTAHRRLRPARPGAAAAEDGVMRRVEVEQLTKYYGDTLVLDAVDLGVEEHEVVCLIGASGSGKSTLLRCIAQLVEYDHGTIRLDGVALEDGALPRKELRKRIGIVFQAFNLFPHLTVLQNITLAPRKVHGTDVAAAKGRARELLELFGMHTFADSYPEQLSGGQQQRVAIVRALATDPEVLLLDEITAALDPELIGGVLDVIRDLKAAGMTMVIVTHEMGFARDVADRVCFLDEGRIVEQGPPSRLLSDPQHERTRRFLQRIIDAGRL
jgi:ABC-type polar amino acid transport system ATPase subunit